MESDDGIFHEVPGVEQPTAPSPGSAFVRILQAHNVLPTGSDVSQRSVAVSEMAKLRAATEAHPLESIDAVSRLRALEKQEEAELRQPAPAWYNNDPAVIATKVVDTAVAVMRELWDIKSKRLDDMARAAWVICTKDDRSVYVIILCMVLLLLFRARARDVGAGKQ
jgi:hypothetical protein